MNTPTLSLPMQAPPVYRSGPATHASATGVEADLWGLPSLDDIVGGVSDVFDTVSKVAPIVGKVAPIAAQLGLGSLI